MAEPPYTPPDPREGYHPSQGPGRPFKKGQSGNPSGRPSMKKLKARLRQFDADAEAALIRGVREGDAQCIRLFFAYREGLPYQRMEHSGPEGGAIVIEIHKYPGGLTGGDTPDAEKST